MKNLEEQERKQKEREKKEEGKRNGGRKESVMKSLEEQETGREIN